MMVVLVVFFGVTIPKGTTAEKPLNTTGNKTLLITNDFGSVSQCKTYEELMHVANSIISGMPDILTIDAVISDVCHYKSSIGQYRSGLDIDALYEAGYDPYGVMVSKLKEAGITFLAGIRVNDNNGRLTMWTPWEREHKEWSLGKDTGDRSWRAVGDLRQMDFSVEGVRARRLAIIKEVVDKYDVDGIQLDFGRTPPYLSEPKREKAKYVTQFVREVRKVLDDAGKSKGRHLLLGAILPWDMDFCEQEGLEIKRWISEGLVSFVSPGEWVYADWNIPLEDWARLTAGTGCKLYPMTCGNVSPTLLMWEKGTPSPRILGGGNMVLDRPKICAMAETFYSQGADGIMFYNFDVLGPAQVPYRYFTDDYPFLRDWTDPVKIQSMSRHYFFAHRLKYIPTAHYAFGIPHGYAPDEIEAFPLFPLYMVGDEVVYTFRFASDLTTSTAVFRFKLRNMTEDDEVSVMINNTPIAPDLIHLDNTPVYRVTTWEAPISMPPFRSGENEVRVRMVKNDFNRTEIVKVGLFEILVEPAAAENPVNTTGNKKLLITSDFGCVSECKTYEELMYVANAMISARPDIQTIDAVISDECYYKSSIGHFQTGRNDAIYEAGHDPYGVMVSKLKEAGITFLAGIRVNDHHGDIVSWTPWEREHKEWSLGKDTGDRSYWAVGYLRQMDFSIEGVRARRLAIIKEVVTKYDVDGIQLDFGRSPPYLSEPKREKAKYVTQFVRDVRKVLDDAGKSKGRHLLLGAILPWDLDFCEREGLEIKRWISEGLVSYVSPGEWIFADWNIPLEGWVKLTAGTDCKIYPMTCCDATYDLEMWEMGTQTLLRDNRALNGPKIRAIAETFYSQGADGFAFYNYDPSSRPSQDKSFTDYYPFLRDLTDPVKIQSMSRHYFFARRLKYIPTEHYSFGTPQGYAPDEIEAFTKFPLHMVGDEAVYNFRFAGDLTGSTAVFRFKLKNITENDEVSVTINNTSVTSDPIKIYTNWYGRVATWEAPVSMPPFRSGENEVRVRLVKSKTNRTEIIKVGEFEILVEPAACE